MRTETDPTESPKEWTPFGPKVERKAPEPDTWQKVPDAPGVEYNWKTGKTRTNIPLPFSRMADNLVMFCNDTRQYARWTDSDGVPINIVNEWGPSTNHERSA